MPLWFEVTRFPPIQLNSFPFTPHRSKQLIVKPLKLLTPCFVLLPQFLCNRTVTDFS